LRESTEVEQLRGTWVRLPFQNREGHHHRDCAAHDQERDESRGGERGGERRERGEPAADRHRRCRPGEPGDDQRERHAEGAAGPGGGVPGPQFTDAPGGTDEADRVGSDEKVDVRVPGWRKTSIAPKPAIAVPSSSHITGSSGRPSEQRHKTDEPRHQRREIEHRRGEQRHDRYVWQRQKFVAPAGPHRPREQRGGRLPDRAARRKL
jgi:hypothetical protein